MSSLRELLDKMDPEWTNGLGTTDEERIERISQLRLQAITEHLAEMHKRPEIEQWKMTMSALFGPKGKIHLSQPLPWDGVLLVGIYGEAPYNWPDVWSDDNVRRVERWLKHNQPPFGVKYIPKETA